jgi:hypothetical protein
MFVNIGPSVHQLISRECVTPEVYGERFLSLCIGYLFEAGSFENGVNIIVFGIGL